MDANSILSYVVAGGWERGVNIFAVTAIMLLFTVVMSISWVVRKLIMLGTRYMGARGETAGRQLNSAIKYISVVGAAFYSLSLMGVHTSTLLASAGILSAVIGFGAKPICRKAENVPQMKLLGSGRAMMNGGEVTGSRGASFNEPTPYGMVEVKRGYLKTGVENNDSLWGANVPTKEISVDGFWMDQSEVTNAMYRQFVEWVRDSIIRERLAGRFNRLIKPRTRRQ